MNSKKSNGARRLKTALAGAVAVGAVLALPSGASASTVECSGKVVPANDSKAGLAYGYSFSCGSPEGDATQIDAYSILSNKDISTFSTEVLVIKDGVPLNDQSFGCEGSFPSDGFGCFGKAALYNQIEGGFTVQNNPCSNKSLRKGPWHMWIVAAANKINPTTGAKTMTTSEPIRLRVPSCKDIPTAGGKGGKGSKGGSRA